MSNPRKAPFFVYLGVLLVSAVALGAEILFTRILALMLWHHFTYVVIGVALLGFGAAGSHVMVRAAMERRLGGESESTERRLVRYSLGLTLSVPLTYLALIHIHFAPLGLAEDMSGAVALMLIYVLIALPFYFAGLAICEAIRSFPKDVGAVYFADLVGAGLGALIAVWAIEPLTGPGALMVFGASGGLAAVAFALARPEPKLLLRGGVGLLMAAGILYWIYPAAKAGLVDPPLAPTKELAMMPAFIKVDEAVWNPLARIDITAPLPTQPTMGGAFPPDLPKQNIRGIFQDGSAPTLFMQWDGKLESMSFLRDASAAAGHIALEARGKTGTETMAIGVGGGIDLAIALQFGVKRVTGVEINSSTRRLLEDTYADFSGGLVARDDVELVNAEGRHFARSSGRKFDLIQMSGVDTYTALSTGAYTLSESYLYTLDAVEEFLAALKPGGVLSYSRIVFADAPRETLRLALTAREALERRGIEDPASHMFVLFGGRWAELLVSETAFEPKVIAALHSLVERNGYKILFDPTEPHGGPFDEGLHADGAARTAFFDDYPYMVEPATDDKPFFFNYFKWGDLKKTDQYGGHAYEQKYPIGHLCLLLSLVQTVLLGAFFILRPLRRMKSETKAGGSGNLAVFGYFAALGLGFIGIEVVLLQRFVLFLGHPTWSLVVVLPTLLIAAGVGSLTMRPTSDARQRLRRLLWGIPLVILFALFISGAPLNVFLGLSLSLRFFLSVVFLAPVGFVLGMAFPAGIALIDETAPELVPWAWAVNSFATVFGSTATVLLAMDFGFTAIMVAMIPLYALGIWALLRSKGAEAPPAADEPAAT